MFRKSPALLICLCTLLLLGSAQGFIGRVRARRMAMSMLDPCEKAIWSCCQSTNSRSFVPVRCFELNGCYGLHWMGRKACSSGLMNAIKLMLKNNYSYTNSTSTLNSNRL
ncbi:unnamed protein product [Lepeophtheirus salmonis]|uniref:(salmon louse) hypothetical protein n=1 Tax=Lepeophtheirus salmonis TaxID=72036 RepID=A0A7R8CDW0_LEPSM|nr:unnamed protein product [Lepeophtheirus salmonis]CAF2752604.1 unnamed protein product [Lepeophtheirus salmonis]